MVEFQANYLFLIFLLVLVVCCGYRKIRLKLEEYYKVRPKGDADHEKQTDESPVSLLQVTVSRPIRVIFGDEAVLEKYDPSELAQIPKPRLGEGTLGTLYKAVHKFGSTVTIRKIRKEVASSDDFEFWIKFFGGLRNDSISKPIFSFWYGGEAFVVHEYFCLGSLEELLHGTEGIQYTPLTWKIRQQIALDAAKAVAAVHKQVITNGKALVCGVIKASNILINIDFSARLSSYEIPYLIPPATIIRRNPGRIAPELTHSQYKVPKVFTQKSDVYGFGILLLELVTGKKASVTNLGEYIKEKKRREGLEGIPDKRMVDVNPNVVAFVGIARLCLRNDPYSRPSMDQVVKMIQDLE
ncbi:hypothetical protein ACET3Z_009015 [Daucus carota]